VTCTFTADCMLNDGDASFPGEVDIEVDGEDVSILEVRDETGAIRCDLQDEAWRVLDTGIWDRRIYEARYRDVCDDAERV
jgi:hypothetical protein